MPRIALALVAVFLLAAAARAGGVSFPRDVLPILRAHCFACHSGETDLPKAGLRLDTRKGVSRHVSAGDADGSTLLDRVTRGPADAERMPPDGPIPSLSPEQTGVLRKWIEQGADFAGWERAESERRRDWPALPPRPVSTAGAAAEVDRLVEAGLAARGKSPNPPIDDAVFLRRIYLDAVGRVPTPAEGERFHAARPDRRAKLIDELLASEGHVSRQFHALADALRAKSELSHGRTGELYLWWLKQSLRENLPYDVFVRRLLTATGHDFDDPAVGHYFRDSENRLARVEATAEVFLGTQLGCAQCHNHPYDVWTRGDYHRFAAFFEGTNHYAPEEETLARVPYKLVNQQEQDMRQKGFDKRDWACREADLSTMSYLALGGLKSRVQRRDHFWPQLPGDYQYPDGKPRDGVTARAPFGTPREAKTDPRAMHELADWLTSPRNPKFTLTLVNRLWAGVLGAPVAGELTSVLYPADCRNPELVRFLVQLMIDLKYDRRAFLRVLFNTRTYQRQASAHALALGEPSDFPGPALRRLTAEQAWDSLITLKFADPDGSLAGSHPRPDRSFLMSLYNAPTAEAYWAILEKERDAGRGYVATFSKSMERAGKVRNAGFLPEDLKRASELSAPAPDGHFLRLFGQSDRETADAAWANPTTPQALALMNGPILDVVLADDSALAAGVRAAGTPRDRVRAVYRAVLSREPASAEADAVLARLGDDWRAQAWTLLNTREFLFVR